METVNVVWGPITDGCHLSITLPSRRFTVGEPVELTLTFKNDGLTTVQFPVFSLWFNYDYKVFNQENQQVPLTPFGKEQSERPMVAAAVLQTLDPGQTISSKVEISRLYDLHLSGRYTVEASKAVPRRDGKGVAHVVSNLAEIEIVASRAGNPLV